MPIKKKSVNINNSSNFSPYVINLKNRPRSVDFIDNEKIKKSDSFFNRIKNYASEIIEFAHWLGKLFSKNTTAFAKSALKTLVKNSKETLSTVRQAAKEQKKAETPATVLLDGIWMGKKLSSFWKYWGANFYNKHEEKIQQLAIVNFIIFIGLVFSGLGKFFYRFLYAIGSVAYMFLYAVLKISGIGFLIKFLFSVIWIGCVGAYKFSYALVFGAVEETGELLANIFKKISHTLCKKRKFPSLKFRYLPPYTYRRQLAIFFVLIIFIYLPFNFIKYFGELTVVKGQVLGISEEAINDITSASTQTAQRDFIGAASTFSAAADKFNDAQLILDEYSSVINLAKIIPLKKAQAAKEIEKVLSSAQSAALTGEKMALAFSSFDASNDGKEIPLTAKLKNFHAYGSEALVELKKFFSIINSVDQEAIASLNSNESARLAEQIAMLQENAEIFDNAISELVDLSGFLVQVLGADRDKRYLIIFQNNTELRASGGFIGSFALIDFSRGEIKNIEAPGGGSYDLQGGLHARVSSPQPLHLISSLWEFHDANWWPDWPKSADKLAWFFENGWGSSVDGVIAVTPTVIERLLPIFGPLELADRGIVVTADNFYDVVQARDELEDENKPKAIIKDLIDVIIADLPNRINIDNIFTYLDEAQRSLKEKHILMYFYDDEMQSYVHERNWDGRVQDTNGDYLSVINTNLAGGKTDKKINQQIKHSAEITPDGSIINTVEIIRTHTGVKNEPYSGVRNVNFMRVYVPKGSQLIDASGFTPPDEIYFDEPAPGAEPDPEIARLENSMITHQPSGVKIYDEFNKTVFANWTMVDPGKSITVKLKYKLPLKLSRFKNSQTGLSSFIAGDYSYDTYSLYAQKQSGSISSEFESRLALPDNMKIIALENGAAPKQDNGLENFSNLQRDAYFGAIIQIK
ncbi:MAG: DUF4012 domain-containing protein [bacterium]|nr:DUF4012 domain-containing protein [bacterium]